MSNSNTTSAPSTSTNVSKIREFVKRNSPTAYSDDTTELERKLQVLNKLEPREQAGEFAQIDAALENVRIQLLTAEDEEGTMTVKFVTPRDMEHKGKHVKLSLSDHPWNYPMFAMVGSLTYHLTVTTNLQTSFLCQTDLAFLKTWGFSLSYQDTSKMKILTNDWIQFAETALKQIPFDSKYSPYRKDYCSTPESAVQNTMKLKRESSREALMYVKRLLHHLRDAEELLENDLELRRAKQQVQMTILACNCSGKPKEDVVAVDESE